MKVIRIVLYIVSVVCFAQRLYAHKIYAEEKDDPKKHCSDVYLTLEEKKNEFYVSMVDNQFKTCKIPRLNTELKEEFHLNKTNERMNFDCYQTDDLTAPDCVFYVNLPPRDIVFTRDMLQYNKQNNSITLNGTLIKESDNVYVNVSLITVKEKSYIITSNQRFFDNIEVKVTPQEGAQQECTLNVTLYNTYYSIWQFSQSQQLRLDECPTKAGGSSTVYVACGIVILTLLLVLLSVHLYFTIKRGLDLRDNKIKKFGSNDDKLLGIYSITDVFSNRKNQIYDGNIELEERSNIEDLYNQLRKSDFREEVIEAHDKIPRYFPNLTVYKSSHKGHDRYNNVLTYESSRVILDHYINASNIPKYVSDNVNKKYIATQGPLKNTYEHFWNMIWKENISVIVMLTNLLEDGKVKCHKYWPDLSLKYGDYIVVNKEESVDINVIERKFTIEYNGNIRNVTQYHYYTWPDNKIPFSIGGLIQLIKTVRDRQLDRIVVHCSAGIGRTGCFILSDYILDMSKYTNGYINFAKALTHLRQNRCLMVMEAIQYKLSHCIVNEFAMNPDKPYIRSIQIEDFVSTYYYSTNEHTWSELDAIERSSVYNDFLYFFREDAKSGIKSCLGYQLDDDDNLICVHITKKYEGNITSGVFENDTFLPKENYSHDYYICSTKDDVAWTKEKYQKNIPSEEYHIPLNNFNSVENFLCVYNEWFGKLRTYNCTFYIICNSAQPIRRFLTLRFVLKNLEDYKIINVVDINQELMLYRSDFKLDLSDIKFIYDVLFCKLSRETTDDNNVSPVEYENERSSVQYYDSINE